MSEVKLMAPPANRFDIVEQAWLAPVTAIHWGADTAMFALGDGTVRFWQFGQPSPRIIDAHKGAILATASDAQANGLVTGGDDGQVRHTRLDGASERLCTAPGKWIDHVAIAPWGGLAWAYEMNVEIAHADEKLSTVINLPSSCGGLAFAPKKKRLAIAHYGGATIVPFPDNASQVEQLDWKGSHIAVAWSPDARYLITAMQEQALHVWRLSDKGDLHMAGYPSKPRSLSWSANNEFLATSGGQTALIWPFAGKLGPQGKNAQQAGGYLSLVTSVAWHPVSNILALGHKDGMIALAQPDNERSLYMRAPDGAAVSHLAWRADGAVLAFGSDEGAAGLIDCSGLRKA